LKQDNAKLRSKIVKEKEKKRRFEEKMKAVKEELMKLKLKPSDNWGVAQNVDVFDYFLICDSPS